MTSHRYIGSHSFRVKDIHIIEEYNNMTGRNPQIALKPYLDTIEKHCSQLSRDELIQLVLSLAKDESTSISLPFL